jgi:hypothetical protein
MWVMPEMPDTGNQIIDQDEMAIKQVRDELLRRGHQVFFAVHKPKRLLAHMIVVLHQKVDPR